MVNSYSRDDQQKIRALRNSAGRIIVLKEQQMFD
jgi:hypothetical protein